MNKQSDDFWQVWDTHYPNRLTGNAKKNKDEYTVDIIEGSSFKEESTVCYSHNPQILKDQVANKIQGL